MVTKTKMYLLFILICITTDLSAQRIPLEIKVGYKIPNLLIKRILDNSRNEVQLKDLYNDGLLIIDFWATWCVPCIKEMKFLDSLKEKTPGKFNVLMVTYQDEAAVKKFLSSSSNEDIKISNLGVVTSDVSLKQLFPHKSVPHNVWVDKNGIVKAITSGKEITAENILNFEQEKLITMKIKKDNLDFNDAHEFHLSDTVFNYRSIISTFVDGIGSGTRVAFDEDFKIKRHFQWNVSISSLYWLAYSKMSGQTRSSLIEVHTHDSLKFFSPSKNNAHLLIGSKYKDVNEWEKENLFCYALTLPKAVVDSIYVQYVLNDLGRQFPNIKAKVEARPMTCVVVTKVKGAKLKISDSSKDSKFVIYWLPNEIISIKNAKIDDVLKWILKNFGPKLAPYPLLSEVDLAQDIRFDLDLDFSNEVIDNGPGLRPEMIYNKLRKYGFQFNNIMRPYPKLILYHQN